MLKSIGVKNFRSLKEIDVNGKKMIDIKPLTILLGKNSSGKSSFLRMFPLFKQSVSSRTIGSLAFFGDEVDFGDFYTTLSKKKGERRPSFIEFDFNGVLGRNFANPYIYSINRFARNDKKIVDIPYEVNMKVRYNGKKDFSYISDFIMKFFDNSFSFSVDENGLVKTFVVNKTHYEKSLKKVSTYYTIRRPGFPSFVEGDEDHSLSSQLLLFIVKDSHLLNEFSYGDFRFLRECSFFNKKSMKDFLANEKNQKNISNNLIRTRILEIISKKNDFEQFYKLYLMFRFEEIYDAVIHDLCDSFQLLSYSKPLRANADRYYRSRSFLATDINSDGSNLVDFFANLNDNQQEELQKWMKENLGFWYSITNIQGHKSIYIHENDDVKYNITDMGFGFSQILPMVTQLWTFVKNKKGVSRLRSFRTGYIYAIEQPELHLHPSMQCKLVNAFVKVIDFAKKNNLFVNFIIETHSETIVNQIGRLIRKTKIASDDASVLIFSKESPDSYTKIHASPFDEDGFLTEWPIGFFGEDC